MKQALSKRATKASPRRRGWKMFGRAVLVLLLLLLVARLMLPLVPLPSALFQPQNSSLEFLDREGRPLREVPEDDSHFSRRVVYADIPQSLVEATLAAEDKRFWSHNGVDGFATLRAAAGWWRNRRVVSGASTISQQLIKIAEPRPRTLGTKLMEAAQALRLEQVWDKQRILAEYLNRLDYGNQSEGCAAAAKYYFSKPLSDLSVSEAAFLAGLPQAPTRLNPYVHFERAKQRQQWILRRMFQNGFLTTEEFNRAAGEPLRLSKARRSFQAPHFVDLVLQSLEGKTGARRIHTTLDLELNRFAESALRRNISRLQSHHVLNGAVVILDNRTGNVLALVGSENYFAPASGQVNGAWARRSAGSTLKPFTYLLAFEQGASAATVVADLPVEFATPTGVFSPLNYNRRCYGPMRYRLALANSLNISAVKVLTSIGGAEVLQKRLWNCGFTTLEKPAEFYGLGLTIGNAETRLLELANAYACLARFGEFKPYRLVTESSPPDSRSSTRRVCDPDAAYLIADILSDNDARALAFGANSSLRFDFPVACKTGTSSDFRDNWALGYTPEFTVGVWVGNFDGSPMGQVSGVTGAAPILRELFVHLHERFGTSWYAPPTSLVVKAIHSVTGKLLAHAQPDSLMEKFLPVSLATGESDDDYDPFSRVRLPAEYRGWLASGDNWLADRAVVDESRASADARIVSPLPGTVYYLDPDLPASSRRIKLKAEGAPELLWQSDSLECRREHSETFAIMSEGKHRITLHNPVTGTRHETWIVVKAL